MGQANHLCLSWLSDPCGWNLLEATKRSTMKDLAALEAGAIQAEVPSTKGEVYGEVTRPKQKISRRKCACLSLAAAASLVLVSLLAAAYLMTTLRRGATSPREVEVFLNQVRVSPWRAAALEPPP